MYHESMDSKENYYRQEALDLGREKQNLLDNANVLFFNLADKEPDLALIKAVMYFLDKWGFFFDALPEKLKDAVGNEYLNEIYLDRAYVRADDGELRALDASFKKLEEAMRPRKVDGELPSDIR